MTMVKEKQDAFTSKTGGYLDYDNQFLSGKQVAKKIDISMKTLGLLAESGEFELGRIGGEMVVEKESFMRYLDRYHFKKAESSDDPPVFDANGRLKEGLTMVGIPHTEVPELKKIHHFSERIPMENRSFIRHCDSGTFQHYRIGSSYKMSEDDWLKSLENITSSGRKSDRGSHRRKPGRPEKIQEQIRNAHIGN